MAIETEQDLFRITEVLSGMDAMSIIGQGIEDQTEGLVDPNALLTAALNRADLVVTQLSLPQSLQRVLTATFMNAFVAGIRFEREGGHRGTGEGGGTAGTA